MVFAKKSKKSGKRKSNATEKSDNWLVRTLFRPFPLLWLALIAAIVVLAPRVFEKLPAIGEQDRYQFTSADILLQERPDWVPPHFLASVIERQDVPESILEPDLARTISSWFRNEPWVKRVDGVRISYPPTATVELTFRKPVAVVQLEGRLHPIDADAVILPIEDFSPAALAQFPKLTPSKVPPPLYPGVVWKDEIVQKGARLASQLHPYWNQFDFVAIRLHEKKGIAATTGSSTNDPSFEIVSASGSIIVWGRGPDSTHPGELSFDEKLQRLVAYQERFQGFSKPNGPYEIDITHWTDISRRVLSHAAIETEEPRRR